MNLPSEFDLIQMEDRAARLLRFTGGGIPYPIRRNLNESVREELSEYLGTFPGSEVAEDLHTLIAAIRSLPR